MTALTLFVGVQKESDVCLIEITLISIIKKDKVMSILHQLEKNKKRDSFERRMTKLQEKSYDTKLIAQPVKLVTDKLESGVRSLVVYGEPQSGKTEFMIALVCKLLDLGRQTIFVVMNNNTELETPNFKRFKDANQLNPSPTKNLEFHDLEDKDRKAGEQRVIFCRKDPRILETMVEDARFLKDRVLIDDEADYASPNTKVNKSQLSRINELVGKLGDLDSSGSGVYIGVTATPGRLDLNNTFQNDAKEWVFLEPPSKYRGRNYFFPLTREDTNKSDYELVKLPETGDDPKHLREAFLRYLVKVAILNLRPSTSTDQKAYSMLIHTDGRIAAHKEDKKQIQKIISVIKAKKEGSKIESYLKYMKQETKRMLSEYQIYLDSNYVLSFIIQNMPQNSVLSLNSKNDHDNVDAACNPRDLFTIAIGGNIVSRGLTFKNLISFFFSRGVKGKLQQNTYIQRARMFGYRPEGNFMELSVPKTLFLQWAQCFTDHEISVRAAMAQQPLHIYSKSNRPADAASIEKSTTEYSGTEWAVGEPFELSGQLEKEFVKAIPRRGIDLIKEFLDSGKLDASTFKPELIHFIEESFQQKSDVAYLKKEGSDEFLSIENYSDVDRENVSRKRGGLIAATLQNRSIFDDVSHIILCAKVGNRARFWYRNNTAKKVLRNKKHSAN